MAVEDMHEMLQGMIFIGGLMSHALLVCGYKTDVYAQRTRHAKHALLQKQAFIEDQLIINHTFADQQLALTCRITDLEDRVHAMTLMPRSLQGTHAMQAV